MGSLNCTTEQVWQVNLNGPSSIQEASLVVRDRGKHHDEDNHKALEDVQRVACLRHRGRHHTETERVLAEAEQAKNTFADGATIQVCSAIAKCEPCHQN